MMTTSNFKMSKLDTSMRPVEIKTSTMSNFFIQGLEKERHKKIQNRKDAMIILEVQEKFSGLYKTSKQYLLNHENKNEPYYKLRDGTIIIHNILNIKINVGISLM